ncbi:MAG TPA: JAB domain-containing protein [Archaeoglobaceae archaeon]|nr:JAB domain-containing protein [Archaeoglobaceae archaeon]
MKGNHENKIEITEKNFYFEDRERIIDFLAEIRVYPVYRRGRVYFINRSKNPFFKNLKDEIIRKLDLKSEEDCRKVREYIKKRLESKRKNRPIRKWLKDERPREMLIKYGAENLSSVKLLAILLRTGNEGESAEDLARKILNDFGSLRALDSASVNDLCRIEGIGVAKAAQIKAAIEIGKRLFRESAERKKKIRNTEDVVDYVCKYYSLYLRDAKKEFFNVILLDSGNKPIKNLELSKGGLETSVVDIREVIREASKEGAASIILVHNHPSGEAEPSVEDIKVTERIANACRLIGVRVLDHIIIGKNREDYVSFLERGLIT